jgi:NAD(P)-dependent dehydrogenase (short-subunit alcohol dehydrogenase family)
MEIRNVAAAFAAALILAMAAGAATAADSAGRAVAPPPAASTGGNVTSAQRAVLVTGASTGIGRAITERLAGAGFHVYATARKDADLAELAKISNVQPIRLDVTNDEQIAAAVETVTKAGRGLYGLVNNAGIATVGSIADMKPEEFDLVMKTNAYGPYKVTRAFLPLLTASQGRITTTGSISGILSTRDLAAYSMSKHAIEAFTDSLAAQLEPSGLKVSVVEPGNYDSDIGRNAAARMGTESRMTDRSKYPPPTDVADAMLQFLTEPTPKRRYLVVPVPREAEITIRQAIGELVQLNEGQRFTYSRDELVQMLDAALANSRPRTAAPDAPKTPAAPTIRVQ